MAQLCPQVIVPQIGVGVKVEDVQLREAAEHRPEAAQGDKMFSADQKRQLPVGQDLLRPGFDVGQGLFRAAEAQFQVAAVKDGAVGEVLVLIGTVGLQAKALMAHG